MGLSACLREKASSWRVRSEARCDGLADLARGGSATRGVELLLLLRASALARITIRMLLKSCAMPPVSWPTASIFCDWRSCSATARRACSARLRSVTFSEGRRGWRACRRSRCCACCISTSKIVPSLRRCRSPCTISVRSPVSSPGRRAVTSAQILGRIEVVAGHREALPRATSHIHRPRRR